MAAKFDLGHGLALALTGDESAIEDVYTFLASAREGVGKTQDRLVRAAEARDEAQRRLDGLRTSRKQLERSDTAKAVRSFYRGTGGKGDPLAMLDELVTSAEDVARTAHDQWVVIDVASDNCMDALVQAEGVWAILRPAQPELCAAVERGAAPEPKPEPSAPPAVVSARTKLRERRAAAVVPEDPAVVAERARRLGLDVPRQGTNSAQPMRRSDGPFRNLLRKKQQMKQDGQDGFVLTTEDGVVGVLIEILSDSDHFVVVDGYGDDLIVPGRRVTASSLAEFVGLGAVLRWSRTLGLSREEHVELRRAQRDAENAKGVSVNLGDKLVAALG